MKLGFSFVAEKQTVTDPLQAKKLGITVNAPEKVFENAVYRETFYSNETEKDSPVISDIWDTCVFLPLSGLRRPERGMTETEDESICVTRFNGVQHLVRPNAVNVYGTDNETSAKEYRAVSQYLQAGDFLSFSDSGHGRASEGLLPFLRISSKSGGYIIAIGWSGDWKAEIDYAENGVILKAGMLNAEYYLKPGETVRTTSVLIMEYAGDAATGYNQFRRLLLNHFSPLQKGQMLPIAFESWGGLESDIIQERLRTLRKAGACFTHHWMDAGWNGKSTAICRSCYDGDWATETGNWQVNMTRHPDGMHDIVATGEDCGMPLMLWVEPERNRPLVPAVKEHPQWYLEWPDADKNDTDRNLLLNLGDEDALAWITDQLSDIIRDLHIACYRQDFNCDPAPVWELHDESHRRGMTEIRYINGFYRLYDSLLTRFPGLLIDNCASGGRRIELEALRRSFPFFRSDFQCGFNAHPDVTQSHGSGLPLLIPFSGCTTKHKNDFYAARSTYAPSWGTGSWNAGFQTINEEELSTLVAVTKEYQRIQPYFYEDFYPILSPAFDETAWTVWQYHDPAKNSGIVMAFRRAKSEIASMTFSLRAVEDGRTYELENLNDGEKQKLAGKSLSEAFTVSLPERRSSIIFEYKAKE